MKCAWHPLERGVGVCASCLRERLLALTAPAQDSPSPGRHSRFPSPQLPPFPRYVPPAAAAAAAPGSRRSSSILSVFFGRHGSGDRGHWLPRFLRRRRRNKSTSRTLSGDRKYPATWMGDRGMSPESSSGWWPERAGWHDEVDESPRPHRWGRPKGLRKRAASAKHQDEAVADITRVGMCCSPLGSARASRQRPWMVEVGFSGELGTPAVGPHHRRYASTGGALHGPDRSRVRMADFVDFR